LAWLGTDLNPQQSSTFSDDISGLNGLSLLKSWNLIALYRGNVTDLALQSSWTAQVGQDRTIVDGYIYLCNHGFGDEFWVHPRVPNFQNVLENYQGKQECREGLS
jgi:hypothetical protein